MLSETNDAICQPFHRLQYYITSSSSNRYGGCPMTLRMHEVFKAVICCTIVSWKWVRKVLLQILIYDLVRCTDAEFNTLKVTHYASDVPPTPLLPYTICCTIVTNWCYRWTIWTIYKSGANILVLGPKGQLIVLSLVCGSEFQGPKFFLIRPVLWYEIGPRQGYTHRSE